MNRLKFLVNFQVLVAITVFLASCGDSEDKASDNFDRVQLLDNIGNHVILAAYSDFSEATATLNTTVNKFAEDPTAIKLEKVQDQWKIANKAYKKAEMFNFGPVDQLNLTTSIDNWPTNATNIQNTLETSETIDNAYIKNLGSSTKGLPAIEYLIFDEELSNASLTEKFKINQKRIDFLVALSENLNEIADSVYDEWKAERGGYITNFIGASGKDVGSSTNILANNLIQLVEFLKNQKVGVPLGKKSMGSILPENVETPRAHISLELIRQNLVSIREVFTGDVGSNPVGFAEYLDAVDAQYDGELLSVVITGQINTCMAAADDIDISLKQALSNEPVKVDKLFTELQRLVIYLKTDMMSSLGLLVTFSDNDGD